MRTNSSSTDRSVHSHTNPHCKPSGVWIVPSLPQILHLRCIIPQLTGVQEWVAYLLFFRFLNCSRHHTHTCSAGHHWHHAVGYIPVSVRLDICLSTICICNGFHLGCTNIVCFLFWCAVTYLGLSDDLSFIIIVLTDAHTIFGTLYQQIVSLVLITHLFRALRDLGFHIDTHC